jgi:glucans biosynthesis protein
MPTPIRTTLRRAAHQGIVQATLSCALLVMLASQAHSTEQASTFEQLDARAKQLAARDFEASPPLPEALHDLDYDSYRLIAFEHSNAIWKDPQRPFWLECFHRGYLYRDKVSLHLIEDGRPHELPLNERLFQYRGKLNGLSAPPDAGFAGFRVLGKFESSPHPLEIASFLGASYFRAIGQGQVYGTSARGLAIDVGLSKAEEFPVFREFWIQRPKAGATQLRFWALLDSPSVAGAYQFVMRPGEATTFDVIARLYFRRRPEKLGLAPLTSMWMWGDGRVPPQGERRPHVHDADGLLVQTSDDQWIWRPLARQSYPSLTHYDLPGVRGFGLLQRDRDPGHYLDDEAKYHQRPSVWIEPKAAWTSGHRTAGTARGPRRHRQRGGVVRSREEGGGRRYGGIGVSRLVYVGHACRAFLGASDGHARYSQ